MTPDETARAVLEVAPAIVRAIRSEMRQHRAADLSVPQFRTMAYLNHHPGASLSDVAEHIGLTLPTMSKMVDGLVARKLAIRETHTGDRRRITLSLTPRGRATWEAAREATLAHLAEQLAALSADERAAIVQAMDLLRPIFVRGPKDTN
jgi:DNA-binding MarR family transcriptional regulator